MNSIELSIFSSRVEAVCDEMGAVLKRSAFSPNIKDRLDFSCAVFDANGQLSAQAAHIPVHLGSMAYAMADIVNTRQWQNGDMVVVNDPYLGGTHLPDVTVIAPVFVETNLVGFVANRAHHANIGATSPGSMPVSSTLAEEGIVIPPTLIVSQQQVQKDVLTMLCGGRDDVRAQGDFSAQISANRIGAQRLQQLVEGQGIDAYQHALVQLNDYGERLALAEFRHIKNGTYRFADVMDDDGMGQKDIRIEATIDVKDGHVSVDFNGTAEQVSGNINCPLSVAAAAVFYVFRCLLPDHTPACAGTFRPIQLRAPTGSLLNAERPAAVAAGNVETSTRVVDVVLGAMAQALPEHIPAASHGSMNNVAMGSEASDSYPAWDYYETMGGGMGGSSRGAGLSGVQTHMTNTLNTPVESIESHYPLRVERYQLRPESGGQGRHKGGDGLLREFVATAPATLSLLTERRSYQPWGLQGGQAGQLGENRLNGRLLPAKTCLQLQPGDALIIASAGGGGWGAS